MPSHRRLTARFRRARALAATAPLVLGAALLSPSIVLADCAMPPPLAEAIKANEIVFVGTVVGAQNLNRWATVEVEEVWRGPDQAESVLVQGGGPNPNGMSSVDRTFEVGVKYIFFPYPGDQGGLADNSCTNTTQWGDDMLALRPAEARAPIAGESTEDGFDLSGVLVPLAVAVVVGLVLVGAGLIARGRDSG